MKWKNFFAVIFIIVIFTLIGCAPKIQTIKLSFTPSPAIPDLGEQKGKITVGIAQFEDLRKDKDYIGRLYNEKKETIVNYKLPQDTLAKAFTDAVIQLFEKAGFKTVALGEIWDLNPVKIKPDWPDIVVGGNIQKFWGETNIFADGDVNSNVRIRLTVASKKRGETIWSYYIDGIDTGLYPLPLSFSKRLEQRLNNDFSMVVSEILKDGTLKTSILR